MSRAPVVATDSLDDSAPMTLRALPRRHDLIAETARALTDERSTQAVMVLNLDDFKDVNHAYGREAGDEVVLQFAELVHRGMPAATCVAWLGADTIGVVQP